MFLQNTLAAVWKKRIWFDFMLRKAKETKQNKLGKKENEKSNISNKIKLCF
jgi:hypothetical protein